MLTIIRSMKRVKRQRAMCTSCVRVSEETTYVHWDELLTVVTAAQVAYMNDITSRFIIIRKVEICVGLQLFSARPNTKHIYNYIEN